MNFSKYAILAFLGASLLSLTSVSKWFEIINKSDWGIKATVVGLDKDGDIITSKLFTVKEKGREFTYINEEKIEKVRVIVGVPVNGGYVHGLGNWDFDLTEDLSVTWDGKNLAVDDSSLASGSSVSVPNSSSSSSSNSSSLRPAMTSPKSTWKNGETFDSLISKAPAPITSLRSFGDTKINLTVLKSFGDTKISSTVLKSDASLLLCPEADEVKNLLSGISENTRKDFETILLLQAEFDSYKQSLRLSDVSYSSSFFKKDLEMLNNKKTGLHLKATYSNTETKCSYYMTYEEDGLSKAYETALLSFVLR